MVSQGQMVLGLREDGWYDGSFVWMTASIGPVGDSPTWREDFTFHTDNGSQIVDHYQDPDTIVACETGATFP